MRSQFTKSLLVVSLSAVAMIASAQNNTPRDNSTGSTNGTTQNGAPQSGAMSNQSGTMGNTTGTMSTQSTMKYRALSDADVKTYKSSWAACNGMTGSGQTDCRTKFAKTWSQVDPKCQKVANSGSALDDCLKGADHGQ